MKYKIILIVLSVLLVTAWFEHMQHYNQDSKTTATSGILFKKTLNLNAYKHVADGNNLWGKYNRYSRSDRHDEALTVYCNKYCK